MPVQKLTSVDAFVVVDLPHAPTADGIVRCARKVLVDSTRSLARARTYAWAALGQRTSGASAAINAVGEGRDEAVAAFVQEITPRAASGELTLAAGKGVAAAELSALGDRPPPDPTAFAAGVVACAGAVRNLEGARVAIEHDAGSPDELRLALGEAGAEIVAEGPDAPEADADVLLFGSKAGLIDHDRVVGVNATLLVPTGDLPFTPRALAVAARGGITVLPDFLTTSGALAARAGLDPTATLEDATAAALAHEEGPVLGACAAAEKFLSTWCDELPFGRPIG